MKYILPQIQYICYLIFIVLDADLSDMKNSNEPYDYKFVKWMTKNKVMFFWPLQHCTVFDS